MIYQIIRTDRSGSASAHPLHHGCCSFWDEPRFGGQGEELVELISALMCPEKDEDADQHDADEYPQPFPQPHRETAIGLSRIRCTTDFFLGFFL